MSSHDLDQAKLEAFAGRMQGIMNSAGLALMTSIGHQTGLFDVMAGLPPSTSQEIAQAAGLNERYVREWLGAMVTGRIVEYNPAGGTYRLPPEHAALLTRLAGPRNMAAATQLIAVYADVEDRVIYSFRNGGGVPLSAYPRFPPLMDELSRRGFDAVLINTILPLVPGLPGRLEAGIEVADIGCGAGHALNLMAQAFPNSRFSGYDISQEAIAMARTEAAQLGLTNTRFLVQDVALLDTPGQYDLITAFDVIHDLAQPSKTLRQIARALRPEGVFLMVDIAASSHLHENLDHPMGPFLYANSTLRCMTVSLAENGEGLGTMWGEQKARQMLAEAGFTRLEFKRVPGAFNYYCIATKG